MYKPDSPDEVDLGLALMPFSVILFYHHAASFEVGRYSFYGRVNDYKERGNRSHEHRRSADVHRKTP